MNKELLVKTLALGVVVLFFIISNTHSVVGFSKNNSGISLITLNVVGITGGDNWYGSDNSFTFSYESDEIAEIYYCIDGNWSLYNEAFNVAEGGNHILEWYAVDYKQNQSEIDGPFSFKVDKTKPEITLEYEVVGGNPWIGWKFRFTAIAVDSMIGMDLVEFYLNGVLQETAKGPGPEYTWNLLYLPLPNVYFYAIAFDKAGNSAKYYIEEPTNIIALKSSLFFSGIGKEIDVKSMSNNILSSQIIERKNNKVTKKSPSSISMNEVFDPAYIVVVFNREIGENDWINSNVSISILYESDRITDVFYQINNESWMVYTNPVVISEDGFYVFSWYVIDSEGYFSTAKSISFKVDLTSPEISLIRNKLAINKVKFIAEVNDSTSGIDRVRFQSLRCPYFSDYDYPYEWIWTGFLKDRVIATVYDKAGNYNSCLMKTRGSLIYSRSSNQLSSNPLFIQILQKIMNFKLCSALNLSDLSYYGKLS